MNLTDVNVLAYAHREDAPGSSAYWKLMEELINSDQAYGYSEPLWQLSRAVSGSQQMLISVVFQD